RYTDFSRKQPAVKPVKDLATTRASSASGYEEFGVEGIEPKDPEGSAPPTEASAADELGADKVTPLVPSPFEIKEKVIYHPPHISPRLRAQDSVLLACQQPFTALEERDCLEIIIRHDAHDDIRRRLDQYGVFDRQLFPDLDGIAKWLRYRVFESKGAL